MAMWVRSTVADYEKPLTRYAAAITGDAEIARDVVQDTFLKLCRADRPALNGRLAAWLYTTCRNGAIDVRRKSRRTNPASTDVETRAADQPSPGSAAEQKETAGEMLRLVALLPENQREVIRLRFQGGLKYREISEVTGLTVSNVGFLIHTAIDTIRKRMSDPDE